MSRLKKTPKNRPIRKAGLSNALFDEAGGLARSHKPDYVLIIIACLLLVIGVVIMYSISPALAASQNVDQHYFISKQFIAIGLGVVAFIIFSVLPLKSLARFKKILIWLSLIMLLAVQLFGAQRWIQIGGFSFQTAELVKFAIVVWVACFLVDRLSKSEIESTKKTLYPLLFLIGLTGFFIAGLQSDLGSAGVIILIAVVMAFSAGIPIKRLALVGAIVAIGTFAAIASTPYRQARLATFLNPASDCQVSGYQSCQALIAIGSGGMFGLGVGSGVQAYGYLPEAENDSIFAIIGEKFGFIGTTVIVGLYGLLFARMRKIILHTSDSFSRLLVIGVLTWLGMQTIVNIGAMIGLFPLKGITLPLISYGGTSLVFVLAALGVVFKISKYTAYAPVRNVSINESGDNSGENTIGGRRQRRPHYASVSSR